MAEITYKTSGIQYFFHFQLLKVSFLASSCTIYLFIIINYYYQN